MSSINKTSIPPKGSDTIVKGTEPPEAEAIKVSLPVALGAACSCDAPDESLLSKLKQSIHSMISSDTSQGTQVASDPGQQVLSNNNASDPGNNLSNNSENGEANNNHVITENNSAGDPAEIIGLPNEGHAGELYNENGLPIGVDSVPRDLGIGDLTLEQIEAMKKAEAGGEEGGHSEDLLNNPYGLNYIVQSVPRDLGIGHDNFGIITEFLPPPPLDIINPPAGSPPGVVCDLTALDDKAVLHVTEDVCFGCDKTTITTTISGDSNVLANDSDPAGGKFFVSAIAFDDQPPVELKNGTATIHGEYGNLTINSDGTYNYVMDPSINPKGTDVDIFTYTVTDVSGCIQTAKLEIDFSVLINLGPKAVDDCATLTIVESECGPCHKTTITSTTLSGAINVLTNDKNITAQDIIKSVSFDNQAAVDLVNGKAMVKGEFGTLTLNANGTYSYALNANVAPSNCDVDVFKYTVYDPITKCFSTACLDIHLNVVVNECKPPVCEPPPPPVCEPHQPPVCEPPKPPVGCEPHQPPVCEPPKPPVGCEPHQPPVCEPPKPPIGCEPHQPPVCEPPKPPVCEPHQPPICEQPKPPVCGEHQQPNCDNKGSIQVTFDSTSASYDNSFGYYIKDCNGKPTTGAIIWSGVHEVNANTISNITGVDPSKIGFFIIPNGQSDNASLSNGEKVNFVEVNGQWEATPASNPSNPIQGTGANVFFDNPSLNADGISHVQTSSASNGSTLSWEDLVNGGDKDFNDVVVTVKNTSPACAMPPACDPHQPPVCEPPKPPVSCEPHQPPACEPPKPPVSCEPHQPPVCEPPKPPVCEPNPQPHCDGKGSIQVTFDSTSAGYDNSFGYYIKDCSGNPTTGVIIWSGAHETSANSTFTISGVDPSQVGFFIIPNGNSLNPAISSGENVTFKNVGGVWEATDSSSHQVLNGQDAHAYFDNPSLNVDGISHVQAQNGNVGWEDLLNGGDKDFNDVVVTLKNIAPVCEPHQPPVCEPHQPPVCETPKAPVCETKPPVCEDKQDKCDDKPVNCDNNDHKNQKDCDDNHQPKDNDHKNSHDCEAQSVWGNVIQDCDKGNCKVTGFKYYNEDHQLVNGKCAEAVTTASGACFTMQKDGSFTHIQHDNTKSFNDAIEFTTHDSKGNSEKSYFNIHTSDMAPEIENHGKSDSKHGESHDYIVDSSDVAPKFSINMKDLGLGLNGSKDQHNDNSHGVLGANGPSANDNSHANSNNHSLPLVAVDHPCPPPSIEHQFQNVQHEVHVVK